VVSLEHLEKVVSLEYQEHQPLVILVHLEYPVLAEYPVILELPDLVEFLDLVVRVFLDSVVILEHPGPVEPQFGDNTTTFK
jgi:hypothetical protein